MNVTAHQEKEKNEETKTDRRKEKTGDRFLKSCVLLLCGRLGGSTAKKSSGVPGVTGTLGKANSHFDPTERGRRLHHHVEAAVDWCRNIDLALKNCISSKSKKMAR